MTNPSEIHPLLIKTQTNRSSPEVYLMLPEDIRREVYFETVQYCILFILADSAKTIKKTRQLTILAFQAFAMASSASGEAGGCENKKGPCLLIKDRITISRFIY